MAPINTIVVIFTILGVGFTAAQTPCSCSSETELWGEVDPNVFYFCDNGLPLQGQCASGRGFIKNGTVLGCVPFQSWPTTCINQVATAPVCTGVNVNQPSEATNPNQYYLCSAEGETALLLSCNPGLGFVAGGSTDLGCVDWATWRAQKNCNQY